MSKGYHSRSPEEFQEYLKKLQQRPGKKGWSQLIILADIVILVFVFYLVSKSMMQTSEDRSMLVSNKFNTDGLVYYFSRGEDNSAITSQYFLFIRNNSLNNFIFPANFNTEFRIETEDGMVCASNNIAFKEKTVPAGETVFLPFEIDKSVLDGSPPQCKSIYKSASERGIQNFIAVWKKSNVATSITFKNAEQTFKLHISRDFWVKQ